MGWDYAVLLSFNERGISIHPSRVGWDLTPICSCSGSSHFNPPIPCGMGPKALRHGWARRCISIHPSRVGWDVKIRKRRDYLASISIHPSRVGWDHAHLLIKQLSAISIHPSRVGWDGMHAGERVTKGVFQSTHPVWDGTAKNI